MSVMAQQSDTTPGGIRDTVTSIIADSIALVRGHIELARSEIKDSAKAVAIAFAALTIALAMLIHHGLSRIAPRLTGLLSGGR